MVRVPGHDGHCVFGVLSLINTEDYGVVAESDLQVRDLRHPWGNRRAMSLTAATVLGTFMVHDVCDSFGRVDGSTDNE